MTRDQILSLSGAEIVIKFEHIDGGIRAHSSFQYIALDHMAIAVDHLQQEALKMLSLAISTESETIQ